MQGFDNNFVFELDESEEAKKILEEARKRWSHVDTSVDDQEYEEYMAKKEKEKLNQSSDFSDEFSFDDIPWDDVLNIINQ